MLNLRYEDADLTIDRSLNWTGDVVNSIVDNKNPGATPGQYGSQSQSFTYTPTRRLATAKGYYGNLSWTYDANGNRLSETANAVASTYAYPTTSNRLLSVTPPGGAARNFSYYGDGSILADTRAGALGMNFEYDMDRRLSKAYPTNAPGNAGVYGYDAFNRLASRKVTNGATTTTTLYVHDLDNHIIAETDASGVTRREYIWLNDLPIAVVDRVNTANPQIYFVHTDHLGRPARMVNSGWTWVWDVIYSPFGGVSAIFTNPAVLDMRFPGQWFQLESGLAYNWNRHYDATLGRYLQPDPIGFEGGRNLYGYVGGSPLAYSDPQGLGPLGGALGGLGGAWLGGLIGEILDPLGGGFPGSMIGRQIGRALGDWGEELAKAALASKNAQADDAKPNEEQSQSGDDAENQGKKCSDASKRPSRVRKATEQNNWDKAGDGDNGGKLCPTCGKEVTSKPGTKWKDWDNDHNPKWRDRDIGGKSRKDVLDEYNKGTRLRCVSCNRADN